MRTRNSVIPAKLVPAKLVPAKLVPANAGSGERGAGAGARSGERRAGIHDWWEILGPRVREGDGNSCRSQPVNLSLLQPAVLDVVDTYISRHVMPADPAGDALHLALASVHRCDFLVTWNCRHLANANKFGPIRRLTTLLGLYVPSLVTPLEVLEDNGNED